MAALIVPRVWTVLTVVLLLVLGIAGLSTGILFMAFPDGSALGLSPEDLESAPINNYLVPGALLASVFGLAPFIASVLVLERMLMGWTLALTLGVALLVWVAIEVSFMGVRLPVVLGITVAIGVALALLGLRGLHRTEQGHAH